MAFEENEDPEDVREREQLERSNLRMRRIALRSGWVSLGALGAAYISFVLTMFVDDFFPGNPLVTILVVIIGVCLILIAPVASMVDLCLVIRLAWRGQKDLDSTWVLGVPGAVVSFIVMLLFSMAAGARF